MARGISDRLTRTRIFDSHKVNRIAQKKNVKSQCIHYIPLCVGSLKGLVIGLIGPVPPRLRIAFDSSGSEYPVARLRFGFYYRLGVVQELSVIIVQDACAERKTCKAI